mmetsp:Transcript_16523/g.39198  ORF Transcript_16523/g.39198 Transcript_16523/m.39198 type:complete len:243 (-) Transcript_16523:49-777(-)
MAVAPRRRRDAPWAGPAGRGKGRGRDPDLGRLPHRVHLAPEVLLGDVCGAAGAGLHESRALCDELLITSGSCWTSRLNDASEVRPGRCCPAARCVRLASATGREGTTVVGPACGLLGRGDARFPDISSHTVGMLSSGWGLPPRCSAPASPFPASPIRQAPVSSSTAASTAPRATYAMASSSSRAAARRSRCSLRRAAAADDTCQSCSCRPSRGTRRRIISVRRPALEHTGNQLDKLSSLPML